MAVRRARRHLRERSHRGIELERRKFRPHVTLARFGSNAETGHHLAQFMASHGTFRTGPWIADHFALYSSRSGRNGRISDMGPAHSRS